MAGIPTRLNQTSREQVLSADINRMGNLSGKELMDAAQRRSVRADFYNPATNAFDDFSAGAKSTNALPMSGLTQAPSLAGITAVFDMALGEGEGTLPATPGSADISGNQLLRWPAQTVTWPSGGTPDATNPKICLIVATPADVLMDLVSRNILADPVTRSTIPANVYKTSNPVATISVVVGAAASTPVSPAVPTGSLALFEVIVPALAVDSTDFSPVRRAWRSIEFPGTSQHGIVKGCIARTSGGGLAGLDGGVVHRLVIDGELLTWEQVGSLLPVSDTLHTPGNAPGTYDMPTYLYVCGGRGIPQHSYTHVTLPSPASNYVPVTVIESLTAPDVLGYPKADLGYGGNTFPRSACCYVGLNFRASGSAASVPSFYDGDWIYSFSTIAVTNMFGFLQPAVSLTNAFVSYTLAGVPASSTIVDIGVQFNGASDAGFVSLTNSTSGLFAGIFNSPTGSFGNFRQKLPVLPGNPLVVYVKSNSGTGTMVLTSVGYNMNVPRIGR
jgi:hypothetical protein